MMINAPPKDRPAGQFVTDLKRDLRSARGRLATTQQRLGDMAGLKGDNDVVKVMTGIVLNYENYHRKTAGFEMRDLENYLEEENSRLLPMSLDDMMKDVEKKYSLPLEDVSLHIRKSCAAKEVRQRQSRESETYYFKVIKKALPRKTEMMAIAEIESVLRSQRQEQFHYHFWKLLYELRQDGIDGIFNYRTPAFKVAFEDGWAENSDVNSHERWLSRVRKWHEVYAPYIKEMELRLAAEEDNDFSSKIDLTRISSWSGQKFDEQHWVCGSDWITAREKEAYDSLKISSPAKSCLKTEELLKRRWGLDDEFSDDERSDDERSDDEQSNEKYGGYRSDDDDEWAAYDIDTPESSIPDKSVYIALVPDIISPERGEVNQCLIRVCPIIPVRTGDLLGVFSGRIRYSAQNTTADKWIPGPFPNLWLDYSEFTGKLNQIKIAQTDEEINVGLGWECVAQPGQEGKCDTWRILVIATRPISPFEQLIRSNVDGGNSRLEVVA